MKINKDNKQSVPFSRSYWVVPGKLLAGYYPGGENNEEAHKKLKALLDHGIRHVINLMEPDEFNWDRRRFVPYKEQMRSIAETMGCEVTYEQIPIKDLGITSRDEMIKILDHIDKSVEEGKPVYVHCWGGTGRTGTVVGCYLTRHGFASGQKVREMIQELRKNAENHHMSSPDTNQQFDMVLSWVEDE